MRIRDTGFGATSTGLEVVAGVDLRGRRAVVTGAASGIGVETARALAAAGARVTLAVRDVAAGERTADAIARTTPGVERDRLPVEHLDLADLSSVDGFVAGWRGGLDILVNNAGVMAPPLHRTAPGWELQFATNHLGHFALATGLERALERADAARIVSVSSSAHSTSGIDFDDLFFERRPYDADIAYAQSKTANVLFAVEATRRWAAVGITANAVMPGGIWTRLQQHWDPEVLAAEKRSAVDVVKTPEQGSATSVWAATSPLLAGIGGRYLEDCHEAELVAEVTDGLHGVVAHALDPATARRLWDVSEELLDGARRARPGTLIRNGRA